MNLYFHEFLFSVMQFSIEKMILKNKFENRFSKSKTGFRFSNRKPDFRFLLNIPNMKDGLLQIFPTGLTDHCIKGTYCIVLMSFH